MPTIAIQVPALMTGAVMAVLALAVREDMLRHRISNALSLAGLILGLGLTSVASGGAGFVHSAAGALVGCAAFVPFYLLRGMGAGDVKLMGATGAFIGPGGALLAAALALVAGSVLGVAIVIWRLIEPRPRLEGSPSGEVSAVWRAVATISIVRKERFPYAVAIAAGVVAVLWLQGSLGALVAALGVG
jgi:prepilin peptidase CpaA